MNPVQKQMFLCRALSSKATKLPHRCRPQRAMSLPISFTRDASGLRVPVSIADRQRRHFARARKKKSNSAWSRNPWLDVWSGMASSASISLLSRYVRLTAAAFFERNLAYLSAPVDMLGAVLAYEACQSVERRKALVSRDCTAMSFLLEVRKKQPDHFG
jgi:hypothetical protein